MMQILLSHVAVEGAGMSEYLVLFDRNLSLVFSAHLEQQPGSSTFKSSEWNWARNHFGRTGVSVNTENREQ